MAAPQKPKTANRTVVSHKNPLVRRVIDGDALNTLVGVKKYDKKEQLVWEPNSKTPVDITDLDPLVKEYFAQNKNFTVREVEVPVQDEDSEKTS